MSITNLKSKFHQLIDTIEDKEVLLQFMEAIQYAAIQKEGSLWKTLTNTQKSSVMESYEQSLDTDNLIPLEQLNKKYKKWLTK